jgi:hypothetical protein
MLFCLRVITTLLFISTLIWAFEYSNDKEMCRITQRIVLSYTSNVSGILPQLNCAFLSNKKSTGESGNLFKNSDPYIVNTFSTLAFKFMHLGPIFHSSCSYDSSDSSFSCDSRDSCVFHSFISCSCDHFP